MKNAVAAARSSTTMPTWSMRWIVTRSNVAPRPATAASLGCRSRGASLDRRASAGVASGRHVSDRQALSPRSRAHVAARRDRDHAYASDRKRRELGIGRGWSLRGGPDRAVEPADGGLLSRYGKRADLIVHEQEPFNAETSLAALAEGPLTATDAFYVRGHAAVPSPIAPTRGCGCTDLSSGSWSFRSPRCARRSRSAS